MANGKNSPAPPRAESEEDIVRREAVRFLHDEFRRKYRIKYIRGIPGPESNGLLEGISQDEIDVLEDLFLTTVYPDLEGRQERDRSFESLIRLLKNPTKLYRVIPAMPFIALRHAGAFPVAMRIGLSTVIAYNRSIGLENKLVKNLHEILRREGVAITPKLRITPEQYFEAYRSVNYAEGRKMIGIGMWIIDNGKRKATVAAAKGILLDVRDALKRHDEMSIRPIYIDDIMAIDYGIGSLEKIEGVFERFDEHKIGRLIRIANRVEYYYLDKNYGKI